MIQSECLFCSKFLVNKIKIRFLFHFCSITSSTKKKQQKKYFSFNIYFLLVDFCLFLKNELWSCLCEHLPTQNTSCARCLLTGTIKWTICVCYTEFQESVPCDDSRLTQIMANTAKPGHPMRKFLLGKTVDYNHYFTGFLLFFFLG